MTHPSFSFKVRALPVQTTRVVKEWLRAGRGGVVTGPIASGKTWAVREAVNGALWVSLRPGPLQGAHLVADLAGQLDRSGLPVIEALKSDGVGAALEEAGRRLNGTHLVVDQCERLDASFDWDPSDPSRGLWQQERKTLVDWLGTRLGRSPTIVVGQSTPKSWDAESDSSFASTRHEPPAGPSIEIENTHESWWERLVKLARSHPGVLTLARAAIPYVGAEELERRITTLERDVASPLDVLRYLGSLIGERAPYAWSRAMHLVAALGDAPRSFVERILLEDFVGTTKGAASRDHSEIVGKSVHVLPALIRLGLVEDHGGVLSILPAVVESGALGSLRPDDRQALFGHAATRLVASANDLDSLEPKDVSSILRAHTLYLEIGDQENALRTARLHLAGLVELARRTSRDEYAWERACRQYEAISTLLERYEARQKPSEDLRRIRSYVRHYWAWNGRRAATPIPLDQAVAAWREAVELWPDNALWHQRLVQGLIERGDLVDARRAVCEAYTQVGWHPRRDDFLRIRPAAFAMGKGAPLLALELLEPALELEADMDPDGYAHLEELLEQWRDGVALDRLPCSRGNVFFNRHLTVHIRKGAPQWRARVSQLEIVAWGDGPNAAIRKLGDLVAEHAEALVRIPSHQLSDDRLRRKGQFIGAIDLLNSDIGLEHATHRWFIGRLDGSRFIAVQEEAMPPVDVPKDILPTGTTCGLFYGKASVYRDGRPSGPIEQLRPAGSGRSLSELLSDLRDLFAEDP